MEGYGVLIFIFVFLCAYLAAVIAHICAGYKTKYLERTHGKKVQYWIRVIGECKQNDSYILKKSSIRKLKKAVYLAAFEDVLQTIPTMEQIQFFSVNEKEIVSCVKKIHNTTIKAYVAYIISKLDIKENDKYLYVEELLMKFLLNDSIYLRENVFLALYNLGNPDRICEAFRMLSEKGISHNEKLVSDGLLKFRGSHAVLAEELVNISDSFIECYETGIINYLRFTNVSKYNDKYRMYLYQESVSKDMKCCVIRLLARTKSDTNRDAILAALDQNLNTEDWEVAAVAASALSDYRSEEVIHSLKSAVLSDAWHVKMNAAKTLATMNISDDHMKEILENGDQYTIDVMKYQISKEGSAS